MLKTCSKCGKTKPLGEFHRSKRDGYKSKCKLCRSTEGKLYYYATLDHQKARRKKYQKSHPKIVRDACKRYREKYPEYHSARLKKWRKKNRVLHLLHKHKSNLKVRSTIKGKLNHSIGTALWAALSGRKKGRKWQSLVGYSIDDLKRHLEKTMPEGYSWQDYMEGRLHLHHTIPRNFFQFEDAEDVEFRMCWRLENLALLPAEINCSLKDKLKLVSA